MHNFNLKTDKKITQLEVSVKLDRRGHRGSDGMVVGFTITCAISAYNH